MKLFRMLTASNFLRQAGFTMVELLVVISIIGILATAVLAALNPVEQLRKGRDTSRKADASTMLGALDRFQSSFGCYPWQWVVSTSTCNNATPLTSTAVTAATFSLTSTPPGVLSQLLAKSELKDVFSSRSTITNSEMFISVANSLASICYEPESNTGRGGGFGPLRNSLNTAAGTTCTSATYTGAALTATSTCAVCVPQ